MEYPTESLRKTTTIQASFGSQYQQDIAMKLLKELFATWKQTVNSAHRDNHVHIKEE